ncbi:hypothetical protein SISNIDRAFT_468363 [Sistotremastrum niveocremeum HHB9708]|uniref:Uncharacterized protein n=1 Tax=Sistotremastrum niveocremeum HHB9708 TaxID=1314777 RepID=A0A164RI87_9AGAM|nr:hypothetical protein SISNIDRAFT_468363 [Sistotremastrum niveocremeum HHB9708]
MSDGSPRSLFSEIEHSSAYPSDSNAQEIASSQGLRTNDKTLALYEAYAMSQISLSKIELRQEVFARIKDLESDMKASFRNSGQQQQYLDLSERLAQIELSLQALEESCAKHVLAYEARLTSVLEKQDRFYLREEGQDALRGYVTLEVHNHEYGMLRDSLKGCNSRLDSTEGQSSLIPSLINKFTSITTLVQAVEQAGSSSLTVLKRLTDQLTGIEARVIQNQNAIEEAREQMGDALQLGSGQTWERELNSAEEESEELLEVEAAVGHPDNLPSDLAVLHTEGTSCCLCISRRHETLEPHAAEDVGADHMVPDQNVEDDMLLSSVRRHIGISEPSSSGSHAAMNVSNVGDPFKARTWELTVHRSVESETVDAFILKPEHHGSTKAVIDATFIPETRDARVVSPKFDIQETGIERHEAHEFAESDEADNTAAHAIVAKPNPIPEISALQLSDEPNVHADTGVSDVASCDQRQNHPQQLQYTKFSKAYRGLGNLPRNPMNFQEWYESFGCCARESPGIAPDAKGVRDGDLVLHRYGRGSQVWYRSRDRRWVPIAVGDLHPASGRHLKYDQYGVISLIKEAVPSAPSTPQRSACRILDRYHAMQTLPVRPTFPFRPHTWPHHRQRGSLIELGRPLDRRDHDSSTSSVASTPTRVSRRLRRLSPEIDATGLSPQNDTNHSIASSVDSNFQFDVDEAGEVSDGESSTRSFQFHQAANLIDSLDHSHDHTDFEFEHNSPNSPHQSFEFERRFDKADTSMSLGSMSQNPSSFAFNHRDNASNSSGSVRSFLFGSDNSSTATRLTRSPLHLPNNDDTSIVSSGSHFKFDVGLAPPMDDDGDEEDNGETDDSEGVDDDMDDDDSEDDDLLRDGDAIASIFSADNPSRMSQVYPPATNPAYVVPLGPPYIASNNLPPVLPPTHPVGYPPLDRIALNRNPGSPTHSSEGPVRAFVHAIEEDVAMKDVFNPAITKPLTGTRQSAQKAPRIDRSSLASSHAVDGTVVAPGAPNIPKHPAVEDVQASKSNRNQPLVAQRDRGDPLPITEAKRNPAQLQGTKLKNRPPKQRPPPDHDTAATTIPLVAIAPPHPSPASAPSPSPAVGPAAPPAAPPHDKFVEGLLRDMALLRLEKSNLEKDRAALQRQLDTRQLETQELKSRMRNPVEPAPPRQTSAKPPNTTLNRAQITVLKPATAELKQFKAHRRGGPTAENFRLDFVGSRSSSWNEEASKVFRDAFLSSPNYQYYVALREGPMILYRFKCHFKDTLKPLYKKQNPSDSPAKLSAKELRKLQRSARDGRRNRLFRRRWNTVVGHPGLQVYIPLIEALGNEGMSEDESGPETPHVTRDELRDRVNTDAQKQYAVLRYVWRNDPVIVPILRIIDLITLARKFGATGRPERGNWTHIRLPTTRASTRTTIQRRPHNAYLPSFLETLTEYQKEDLKMLEPVPVPEISADLKAEANRFKHVKDLRAREAHDPEETRQHSLSKLGANRTMLCGPRASVRSAFFSIAQTGVYVSARIEIAPPPTIA